jgi:hypothetical protein
MKKRLLVLVLMAVVVGGLFAQDQRNWISGEVSLLGGGARYEFMLNEKFSVGATVFFQSFFLFWNSLGINATGRFYFWKGLYAEVGAGYGTITGTEDYTSPGSSWTHTFAYVVNGFMLTPAIGWKIDVGNPGGFFINPMVGVPLVLGSRKTRDGDKKFKLGVNFRPAFGMGYAF